MNIIIDTNIFIAALLKDSKIREIIVNSGHSFIFPEVIFEEIEEHREELLSKSDLSNEGFNELVFKLLDYVKIVPTKKIIFFKEKANSIIGNIDKDDVPFVATSLFFNCAPIWSQDPDFKKQERIKVYTTKELIDEFGL